MGNKAFVLGNLYTLDRALVESAVDPKEALDARKRSIWPANSVASIGIEDE